MALEQWQFQLQPLGAASAFDALSRCVWFCLQTYLSALTGSIKLLELQLAAVNSTSSSLAGSVSSAFGGNAQQRDSQLDVQVTQLYQVRLVRAEK